MAAQFPRRAGFVRVLDQISAAATSIAANLEEAQAAYSRADFIHAVNVARKEARECNIRLGMLAKAGLVPEPRFSWLINESGELIAILTTIVKRSRENASDEDEFRGGQ
jgi:four helix bundle protein